MDFLSLDPLLKQALEEDLGGGDLTTQAILERGSSSEGLAQATLLAKERLILAGWPVFLRVFQLLDQIEAEVYFEEGAQVEEETTVGRLQGSAAALLQGERVALNFLQRISGVSTLTQKYVQLVAHTGTKILDTRKTTPLWRSLEKYAVRKGGGQNHRMGLYDGVLIKENHVVMAGGIQEALNAFQGRMRVEIEVRNFEELSQAIDGGAEKVLLDNMSPQEVQKAVEICAGRCSLEVSGGVHEGNVVEYAETGVDFISLGVLTHSSPSVDFSLLMNPL